MSFFSETSLRFLYDLHAIMSFILSERLFSVNGFSQVNEVSFAALQLIVDVFGLCSHIPWKHLMFFVRRLAF